MIQFDCIVQEKQIPESTLAELESGLKRVAASVLGPAAGDVNVRFREIPNGAGYRGGELSTTSLVRGSMPPGCDQSVREKLLQDICDMWSELSGCAHDEVVVTAAEQLRLENILIQPDPGARKSIKNERKYDACL